MIDILFAFIAGLFIGAFSGICICALLSANDDGGEDE